MTTSSRASTEKRTSLEAEEVSSFAGSEITVPVFGTRSSKAAALSRKDAATMYPVLATIQDDHEIILARIDGVPNGNDLVCQLARLEKNGGEWDSALDAIASGRINLLLNSVLSFTGQPTVEKHRNLDLVVSEISDGHLRLVYNPAGIDEAHGLQADLWELDGYTVRLPELTARIKERVKQQ